VATRVATANSYPIRRKLGSRNYHERVAGGRSSLRSPDAAMEPENEGVHFRRTQRHPHYRSSENPQNVPRSEPLRERTRRARQGRSVRGHQTPGAGSGRRRVQTLRCVFREPPVAGRHADELGDAAEIHQAAEAAEGHERRWPASKSFPRKNKRGWTAK